MNGNKLASILTSMVARQVEQLDKLREEHKIDNDVLDNMTTEQMEVYKRSHENDGLPKHKNRGHDTEDWQRHKAKQKRKRRNKKK